MTGDPPGDADYLGIPLHFGEAGGCRCAHVCGELCLGRRHVTLAYNVIGGIFPGAPPGVSDWSEIKFIHIGWPAPPVLAYEEQYAKQKGRAISVIAMEGPVGDAPAWPERPDLIPMLVKFRFEDGG